MVLTDHGARVQIFGREYNVSGGTVFSGHWPLQQSHPYLKGVLSYGGVLTYGLKKSRSRIEILNVCNYAMLLV